MNLEHQAHVSLEIDKIIQNIARASRTDLGLAAFKRIGVAKDLKELLKRQRLFQSVEEFRRSKGELPWDNRLSAVSPLIEEAKQSALLLGEELIIVRRLLLLSLRLREVFFESRTKWPDFLDLLKGLRDFSDEVKLLSILDESGHLYDHASDRLARLREKLSRIQDGVRRRGQAFLNEVDISSSLQERVLAMRNGRYVVLVRQDALGSFPGLVMDRSTSGNSVYIEPQVLVTLNNDLIVCQQDLIIEERRILRRLTEKILAREKALLDAEKIIGMLDLFYALSEKIRNEGWNIPIISEKRLFNFVQAKHPLLGKSAIASTISCGEKYRILLVTGPNTGGKTVALKTAGVCVALGWYGFPIPADDTSVLGNIDNLYADIGDEQSIEQNLSTFSAHVTHLRDILSTATENSLILLDELGAGTDPEEGAALGIAFLDYFLQRRSLVLATTHHNPIKRFALATKAIETASVEFNTETLYPTYRLLIGIPGKSNALLIAQRLGLPQSVIERARAAMQTSDLSMEDMIADLQDKRTLLERENKDLDRARKEAEKLRVAYENKSFELLAKKESLLEEADKKAAQIIAEAEDAAKKLLKRIDAISESSVRREIHGLQNDMTLIKENISKRGNQRDDLRIEHLVRSAPQLSPLVVGDLVSVAGSNIKGTLIRLDDRKGVIEVGATRMEIARKKIIKINQINEPGPAVRVKVTTPTGVPSSVMVRGMTVDEALPVLEQYLDRAYRSGYDEVTVIHGRGEGILRREVQALCKRTPYILEQRLGGPGEGGFGVTIVQFKK